MTSGSTIAACDEEKWRKGEKCECSEEGEFKKKGKGKRKVRGRQAHAQGLDSQPKREGEEKKKKEIKTQARQARKVY